MPIQIFILLTSSVFLTVFSYSILSPILPLVATRYDIGADTAQQLASIAFLGIGLSGMIYGPLSDYYGRKKMVMGCYAVMVIFAGLSAQASSIEALMVYQFLQALHAGAGSVISMAIIQDRCRDREAAKVISGMGLFIPFAPGISPLIAAMITQYFGVEGVFCLIVFGALLCLAGFSWCLEETHLPEKRPEFSIVALFSGVLNAVKQWSFLRYAVILGLVSGGVQAYYITSSFVFMREYGVSPTEFGVYQFMTCFGMIVGNLYVHRNVITLGSVALLKRGGLILLGASGLFFILTATESTSIQLYTLCMSLYTMGYGINFSTAMTLGMSTIPHSKGVTSSLMRGMQMTGAFSITAVVAEFYTGSFMPLACTLVLCALSIFWIVRRK